MSAPWPSFPANAQGPASRHPRRRVTARLLAGTALAAVAAQAQAASPALPTGGQFVAGQGSISASGAHLTVTQKTQRGIIDFRSFSIGAGASVQFDNGTGATLSRVTGGNPSLILGSLRATGSLYLLNPQGVVIGKGGVVVTGGSFVASTLDVSNQAFLAGGTLLFQGSSTAEVKNLGEISATGGDVFLIAHGVVNAGAITAAHGTVGLAAGQEVLLKDASDPDPRAFVRVGGGDVTNSGDISAVQAELAASGGNIYALAGNHDGMIKATGSATVDGHVWLTAGSGNVTVSDTIAAQNADGSGGTVEVTGATVSLTASAVIDARGTTKGGTVLIGGDRQGGADPAQDLVSHPLANAETTTVAAGAQILAGGGAGGGAGNGGNVVVWSEQKTSFAGTISVTGGAQGGNGGFAEVSSHGTLAFTGNVDRLAPRGQAGTLLLDPAGLDIVSGAAGNSTISTLTTGELLQELAGGNVVVQTGSGDIEVQSSFSWTNASALTLSAFNGIVLDSGVVIANSGGGSVTLRADNTGIGGVSGAGLKSGFGQVKFGAGAQIDLSGATPGTVSILYDGYDTATGAFGKTKNYASDVAGALTAYELVNDAAQLQAIGASSRSLKQDYALGTGFSAAGIAFTPIGQGGRVFKGIFDGEGQTITGLAIGDGGTTGQNLGLFSEIGAAGIVRNLTLAGATLTGTAAGDGDVGLLAGTNKGTVSNVSVSGAIALGAAADTIGGLVGWNDGAVTQSSSSASVTAGSGSAAIGGLVGFNGLAGGRAGSITASSASGIVTVGGNSSDLGGLAGFNAANGTISSAAATGAVNATGSGSSLIGGLVGSNEGSVASSLATAAVLASGAKDVGGLAGDNTGSITQSLATGAVLASGATHVGGLVGRTLGGGIVTASFWDTETTGQATSAGGTGATTAELQQTGAGTPFAALDAGNTAFGIINGFSLPYLLSEFPTGTAPQLVSGVAGTSAAGEEVTLAANGQILGGGFVGANGYYELLLPSGALGNGSAVLAFLTPLAGGNDTAGNAVRLATPAAATAIAGGASVATVAETGLDIAANAVQVTTDGTGPLDSSLLATAAGALAKPGILYGVSGHAIDVASGVNASFAAGNADIIVDDRLVLRGAGVATLTTNGAITLKRGIKSQASGDAIVLYAGAASGAAFTNNAGANALATPNGRFLVFTNTVGDVAAGGLVADPLYGHAFAGYTPGSLAAYAGDRFVYAETETLTVTPGSASVTYDGLTQTATPSFTFSGLVPGDAPAQAVSGTAGVTGGSGRNAGSYGMTATQGTLASDFGYSFAFASGTFTITPEALTVSAASDSRVYNGTTASTGAPVITSGTVFAGDTAGFTQAFASKNVLGTNGSTLVASGGVSDANGGANYALTFVTAAGTITPAPLTVSAASDSRVYNGTTSSIGAPVITSGTVFAGDTAAFTQAFASANVLGTNGSALVASAHVSDGNGGNNYALTFVTAAGTITPAPLVVAALNASHVAGAPDPVFAAILSGFIAGQTPSVLNGTLRFSTTEPSIATPGTYQILPFGLSAQNYRITYLPAILTVTATPQPNVPPIPFVITNPNGTSYTPVDPLVLSQLAGLSPSAGGGAPDGSQWSALLPQFDENGNPLGGVLFSDSSFIETGPSAPEGQSP